MPDPRDPPEAALRGLALLLAAAPALPGLDATDVLALAVRCVPGASAAGLTVVARSGGVRTVAASSEVAACIDALQTECGSGPALDAVTGADVCRVDDLACDPRWPRFGDVAARRTRVRAVLAARVPLASGERAVLTLFAERVRAFGPADEGVVALLGCHLAQVLRRETAERQAATLEDALASSRLIGTALGIVMTRERCTSAHAWDRLRGVSQRRQRKVRDIAADVVETGELPV